MFAVMHIEIRKLYIICFSKVKIVPILINHIPRTAFFVVDCFYCEYRRTECPRAHVRIVSVEFVILSSSLYMYWMVFFRYNMKNK